MLINAERTVFAQILDHLPRYEFNKCVKRYNGNDRVKRFPRYDQFLCLAFVQLTYQESLRDIETCLNSHHEKLYHIGFRFDKDAQSLTDKIIRDLIDFLVFQNIQS